MMINKNQICHVVCTLANIVGRATGRVKKEEVALITQSFTLGTTAALVHHGYLSLVDNVDILVHPEVMEVFKSLYPENLEVRPKFKDGHRSEFNIEKVVIYVAGVKTLIWVYDTAFETVPDAENGFMVQSVEEVLAFKKQLGRPNDLHIVNLVSEKLKALYRPKDPEPVKQQEALI